jgi:hypothetical protein
MAEWTPNTYGLVGRLKNSEARRQNRLANFMHPRIQSDEQIVAMLSVLEERPKYWTNQVAVVVTNQRLVVIRLGLSGRPKKILVTYPSDALKMEVRRGAKRIRDQYGGYSLGRVSINGSFGATEFWARGWMQDQAEAVAKALEE